ALGVTRVLATSACGSLRPDLPPGSLALLTDFIALTRARPWTLAPLSGRGDAETRRRGDRPVPESPRLRVSASPRLPTRSPLAIITNAAAGLTPDPLTHADVEARVAAVREQVAALLRTAVPRIAALPNCTLHRSEL